MSTAAPNTIPLYVQTLDQVITDTIAPAAFEVDQTGSYPQASLDALAKAGLAGTHQRKGGGRAWRSPQSCRPCG